MRRKQNMCMIAILLESKLARTRRRGDINASDGGYENCLEVGVGVVVGDGER